MRRIKLLWADAPSDITESEWNRHLERCPRSNLFHSWAFGAATAEEDGFDLRRGYIIANGDTIGLVQIFEKRRLLGCRQIKLLRGPVFDTTARLVDQVASMKLIKASYPLRKLNWCTLMPDLPDSDVVRSIMSDSGFNRILAGYQTVWLDLRKTETGLMAGLEQKWRNQLRKAMASDLTVSFSNDPAWLLDRYEEHKRQATYSGPSAAVLSRLDRGDMLVATASLNQRPAAAVLFVRHGKCATYQVGWASEESKRRNAHNLLLWKNIVKSKESGIEILDLGGIDPITAPGVAHFKQGLGGFPVTLAGTFI